MSADSLRDEAHRTASSLEAKAESLAREMHALQQIGLVLVRDGQINLGLPLLLAVQRGFQLVNDAKTSSAVLVELADAAK